MRSGHVRINSTNDNIEKYVRYTMPLDKIKYK
jgi:hypothetical protein